MLGLERFHCTTVVTDSSWLHFLCNLCCFQFDLSVTNDYELVLTVYEYYDHVFNKVLPLRLNKYIIVSFPAPLPAAILFSPGKVTFPGENKMAAGSGAGNETKVHHRSSCPCSTEFYDSCTKYSETSFIRTRNI